MINKRGLWLQHILLNMSDEELKLFAPVPNPKVVEIIKKRTSAMRFSLAAKN